MAQSAAAGFRAEPGRRVPSRWLLAAAALVALAGPQAQAQAPQRTLMERLTPDVLETVFPGAQPIGQEGGAPPAAPVYMDGQLVGYVYSTLDVVAAPGYTSVPFDVLAGVDAQGVLTGAKVIFHKEPYIIRDPIRQVRLDEFLADHRDLVVGRVNVGAPRPDIVAGATISARAMRVAIFDTARLILRSRVNRPVVTEPTLDRVGFRLASVAELLDELGIERSRWTPTRLDELHDLTIARGIGAARAVASEWCRDAATPNQR